jgi:hypothetical protein
LNGKSQNKSAYTESPRPPAERRHRHRFRENHGYLLESGQEETVFSFSFGNDTMQTIAADANYVMRDADSDGRRTKYSRGLSERYRMFVPKQKSGTLCFFTFSLKDQNKLLAAALLDNNCFSILAHFFTRGVNLPAQRSRPAYRYILFSSCALLFRVSLFARVSILHCHRAVVVLLPDLSLASMKGFIILRISCGNTLQSKRSEFNESVETPRSINDSK